WKVFKKPLRLSQSLWMPKKVIVRVHHCECGIQTHSGPEAPYKPIWLEVTTIAWINFATKRQRRLYGTCGLKRTPQLCESRKRVEAPCNPAVKATRTNIAPALGHMSTRYFHGGNKGLHVGEYLLPPATTKALSTSDLVDTRGNHRTDRVYVTTVYTDAQMYAAPNGKPVVYEVEPEGSLEDDPDDTLSGRSYACEKAKIISIHKVPGKVVKKVRQVALSKGR
ncbi:MAG: NAD(+)--rifampin ADP-ribosyltransferase, partial [Beijerinckiaceae bacterium]